jgi:hypothetical protein
MLYVLYPFMTYLLTLPRSLKLNLVLLHYDHSESHTDEDPDLKSEELVRCSLFRDIEPQVVMIGEYATVIND